MLTLLLLIPALGALLIAFLPGRRPGLVRGVALVAGTLTFLLSWVILLVFFDPTIAEYQLSEYHAWNPRMGAAYILGVDGFSVPMILLASLLALVALMASASIRDRAKGYYLLMLLLESAMLGVFMARDWVLFYIFWELTLIPLFFLIDRWGGEKRQGAALNFVLYTLGGSVFMLLSLLAAYDQLPDHSFFMGSMATGAQQLPVKVQIVLFLGLLVGFGVKMPIFPIHGWLPLAHVQAPSPVSILLSGVLLKMGSYGLVRAAEMLPQAVMSLQGVLATLGFVSLIYGGLLAWRQSDLKAMVAYSSISHMGVVLIGIAALNTIGLTGAVMQMVAHGLVAGVLFLLIGLLYERTHTREVSHYSSLVRVTPRFAFFTTIAFVAAVGMPGTASFISEFHAIVGGWQRWGWLVIIISMGMLISAAYAVRTVSQLFTGPVREEMRSVQDLRPMEVAAAGTLTAGTLLLGIFPASALELMALSVNRVSLLFAGS